MDEHKEYTNKEMQQQMELQLHEQYAINNNANVSSIAALFVTMLASVGAYGYVFLHSVNECSCCDSSSFTLFDLLATAFATIAVLMMIIYLCISLGCRQRMEQFIIYAIRKKYYDDDTQYSRIFPKEYHPFEKEGLNMVQSPYDYFIRCTVVAIILIAVSVLLKFVPEYPLWLIALGMLIASIALIISFTFLFGFGTKKCRLYKLMNNISQKLMNKIILYKWENKIKEREEEYKSIKPKGNPK